MSDNIIKVRANRSVGELSIEGASADVAEWWSRLWPEIGGGATFTGAAATVRQAAVMRANQEELPEVFGEFYTGFRSDISDIDKTLIAAAFVQARDAERSFTTKAANQLLMDQNIKVSNPSEAVRRLTQSKKVFVVSAGRFRVSATGYAHLDSLKQTP